MSDLTGCIKKRKTRDKDFARDYDEGFRDFKIGALLKDMRIKSGLTQTEAAKRLNTTKSAVSRMENHAEDVRLSTLARAAAAFGKKIAVTFQ